NLSIGTPTGATLGTPSSAVLTITDVGNPNPPPPQPFITELVPYSAPVNLSGSFGMRILGNHFGTTTGQAIWNGATQLQVSSWNDTEIDVINMDASLWGATSGTYPVKVHNAAGDSNSVNFTVLPANGGNPPPFVVNGPAANPNPTYTNTTTLTVLGG